MADAKKTRRELLAHHRPTDATRLARLVALEQMTVDVYTLALFSGRLRTDAEDLARAILTQEQLHVEALQKLAPKPKPGPPPSVDEGGAESLTDAAVRRELLGAGIHVDLRRIHDEHGWLKLLERIEGALAGAHFRAVRELGDSAAAQVAAAILADEAQHATVLSRLRHPRSVGRAVPYSVVPADASIQL